MLFNVDRLVGKVNRLEKVIPRLTELGRFFAAGIANTLITIGIYQLIVANFGPLWAYAVAWLAGILIVATVYPTVVYRVTAGTAPRVMMAGLYMTVFVFGLLLTRWLDDLGLPPRVMIFVVAATTSGLSYFGGRVVLRVRF